MRVSVFSMAARECLTGLMVIPRWPYRSNTEPAFDLLANGPA
jgi:hypothetical protein